MLWHLPSVGYTLEVRGPLPTGHMDQAPAFLLSAEALRSCPSPCYFPTMFKGTRGLVTALPHLQRPLSLAPTPHPTTPPTQDFSVRCQLCCPDRSSSSSSSSSSHFGFLGQTRGAGQGRGRGPCRLLPRFPCLDVGEQPHVLWLWRAPVRRPAQAVGFTLVSPISSEQLEVPLGHKPQPLPTC